MSFNYNRLRGRIIEKYGTQYEFAKAMGWSERTLSLKMNGIRVWKQTDICRAIQLLELDSKDIVPYFFNCEVQNIEPTN